MVIKMFDRNKNSRNEGFGSAKPIATSSKSNNVTSDSVSGASAMIGPGVKIKGQITSDEKLVIEGKVDGGITAKSHEVIVGKSGVLNADISAKVVRVDGRVKGDICGGDNVVISKTGNVLGNIQSPRVSLEDGAKFKGSIEMDPGEQVVAELPLNSPSSAKDSMVDPESGKAGAKAS